MNQQNMKQALIKEHKRLADLKYQVKKRLEKLRAGGFKHNVKYTEQDLLNIIRDCEDKLLSVGHPKNVYDYPRLETQEIIFV